MATRYIPIETIGRIDAFSPNITHIYHVDKEKNTRGLPFYVLHCSLDEVMDAIEKTPAGATHIAFIVKKLDYRWELKHRF